METAADLRSELAKTLPRLRALDESAATRDRGPKKWIRKEILGHLIDSVANNHQRFVRAAIAGELAFPEYAQDEWVALQGYRRRPWRDLVDLFEQLNRHVVHAMDAAPAERREAPCSIGGKAPVTLAWLMEDYVRHMRHHLSRILR
jgi:hypothetical protein